MAYVIYTDTPDGPRFAQHVGKTRVRWTMDRDDARHYVRWETAEKAAARIRDFGNDNTRTRGAKAAPLPDNAGG